MTLPLGWYVFSGVRPSSVAATSARTSELEIPEPVRPSRLAATEDGRTPLNTYPFRRGEGSCHSLGAGLIPPASASARVVSGSRRACFPNAMNYFSSREAYEYCCRLAAEQ